MWFIIAQHALEPLHDFVSFSHQNLHGKAARASLPLSLRVYSTFHIGMDGPDLLRVYQRTLVLGKVL